MTDNSTFYIIWNPNGPRPPRFRHASWSSARKEAVRLALESPGDEFFIMHPTQRIVTRGVEQFDYPCEDRDIPF